MRYSLVGEKKEIGAHYTPKLLADFVAENIIAALLDNFEQKRLHVLDPAVGDGELLCSILEVLHNNNIYSSEVSGFDTNQEAICLANERISNAFPSIALSLKNDDFLDYAITKQKQLSMFEENNLDRYDIVIANPPYVRTQIMGAGKSRKLAQQFNLTGRVDLYHAFIQAIAHVLHPGGIAGIIVSNRFLSTKSGASIRNSIINDFDVLHIWDLGDTRLFKAAVLPAVLLVKKKNGVVPSRTARFTSIYSTNGTPVESTKNIITALNKKGIVKTESGDIFHVKHGKLEYGQNPKKVWRIANEHSENWLATVNSHTAYSFGDIGKIRVGVKTTADKIFIRTDWDDFPDDEYPELLKPIITHHIAQRYKPLSPQKKRKIIYPHIVVQGSRIAVNLNDYPKSSQYLSKYQEILGARSYLAEAGRQWYEIWVPQDPNAWKQPKVVFRDITETPTFWLDFSGSVVNGDCYWIVCKEPQQTELLWLTLAVGNSSFIETFYDHRFHNKLYAGRRRFITQYVKEFPLPDPDTMLARRIIKTTKQIYDLLPSNEVNELEKLLDELVWQAFGFNQRNL